MTTWGYSISGYPENCGISQLENGCLMAVFVWNIS
jgi:hypothetical protein